MLLLYITSRNVDFWVDNFLSYNEEDNPILACYPLFIRILFFREMFYNDCKADEINIRNFLRIFTNKSNFLRSHKNFLSFDKHMNSHDRHNWKPSILSYDDGVMSCCICFMWNSFVDIYKRRIAPNFYPGCKVESIPRRETKA